MDLYLIRHAKAGKADPKKWPDDSKRPLTAQGKLDFARSARGLDKILEAPACVYTSPASRCAATAAILRRVCAWAPVKESDCLAEDERPKDAIDLIEDFIKEYGDEGPVALVGHEPQLEGLVEELTGDRPELKKGGVAVLEYDGGKAKLKQLLKPGVLRILAG